MTRRRNTILIAVLTVLAVTAPAAAVVPEKVVVPPQLDAAPPDALYVEQRFTMVQTHDQVVFGQAVNSRGELQDLTLDVFQPEGHDEEFRPVIIWATGGGMTRLANLPYYRRQLVERGYVLVNVDYRVRPELPHGFQEFVSPEGPGHIQAANDAARDGQHDVQAAVRWIRANAGDLRVDQTRIVAAGYSAGAALAWMAAYNHDDPGDSGNPGWPSHVAAASVGAGGYLIPPQGDVPLPGKPPVIAFHGVQDTTGPMAASTKPCVATTLVANVCEYHVYPERAHNLVPYYDELAAETADFVWRHVHSAERIGAALTGLSSSALGSTVTVSGTLETEDGATLAGQRVTARATAGWAEATTGEDGRFTLTVAAPAHGSSTDVLVRYEGWSPDSWFQTDTPIAPTHAHVSASWQGGPAR